MFLRPKPKLEMRAPRAEVLRFLVENLLHPTVDCWEAVSKAWVEKCIVYVCRYDIVYIIDLSDGFLNEKFLMWSCVRFFFQRLMREMLGMNSSGMHKKGGNLKFQSWKWFD